MQHFRKKSDLPRDAIVLPPDHGARQYVFPRPGSVPIGTFGRLRRPVYAQRDCSIARSETAWRRCGYSVCAGAEPIAERCDHMGKMVSYFVYGDWQVQRTLRSSLRRELQRTVNRGYSVEQAKEILIRELLEANL